MEALKNLRKSKKFTQEEMSKLLGFTKSHYAKIEMGQRNPGFSFLKKIKENFPNFDMNSLF